jgi:hypothetical protein
MQRITRKMIERTFMDLLRASGKSYTAHYSDIGSWSLDYAPCYGGWVIHEICNLQGGVTCPMGHERMGNREFYNTLWFAIRLLSYNKKA